MRWRAETYDEADRTDLTGGNPTVPDTRPEFRGAAFVQQTQVGIPFIDPTDERVTFIGDADSPNQHMRFRGLGNDYDGAPTNIEFDQATNPNRDGNVPANPGQQGSAIPQVRGKWYDTLRPFAGFPLPVAEDDAYGAVTGDVAPDLGDPEPLLVGVGARLVAEAPIDVPSRLSVDPSSFQDAPADWGLTAGQWEWKGDKAAQIRPRADSGVWFDEGIQEGRIPSPTGAGGAMTETLEGYDAAVRPMTWRIPPSALSEGSE